MHASNTYDKIPDLTGLSYHSTPNVECSGEFFFFIMMTANTEVFAYIYDKNGVPEVAGICWSQQVWGVYVLARVFMSKMEAGCVRVSDNVPPLDPRH